MRTSKYAALHSTAAPRLLRARARLAEVLDSHRDEIVASWVDAAGKDARVRWPDIDRYLRSLVAGLKEVFREDDWSLAQTIVDGLAERRARTGERLDQAVQRALVAGRHAVRTWFVNGDQELCDDLLLDSLHECVFRFSESFHGIHLESEDQRVQSRIIKSLVMALEARDPYTKGHSISVALLSQKIAQHTDPTMDADRVYLAGLLHDVGKVGIPDSILLKEGPLSDEEWEIMRSHPAKGADILSPIRLYPDVVAGVYSHHENYDGSGYPTGAAGDDIPTIGRIIRVVDSFDAMTTTRVFRKSRSMDDALEELMRRRAVYYDPQIVDSLVEIVETPGIMRELGLASLQIEMGEPAV
ncbi:MAG TPA: HD-GYP domain-containing protein [Actinomycetota bacterium]|nr:HD-GYP domain-containing protein [Actinomycetota bacterium]